MVPRLVVDTSVVIAALGPSGSASRQVLRLCLAGRYALLMSNALAYEYTQVAFRAQTLARTGGSPQRVERLLTSLFRVARWRRISYLLRPNLRDEGDNHVVELAVTGAAHAIVTYNLRDFARGEWRTRGLEVLTPPRLLRVMPR